MDTIDYTRQRSFLDPEVFNVSNKRIDIIGVGATGSYVAFQLAKMGISNIHVWDDDKVEPHNLPNQLYGIEDVGKFKVDALRDNIKKFTNIDIITHNERVTKDTGMLGDIVFLLPDSMAARKEIYENCLKLGLTQICIETRLSATQGRVYAFNPTELLDQNRWEGTLYSDEEAEVSECGTKIMMGASSSMVASIAVWQFIKWVKGQNDEDGKTNPEFELMFSMCPNFNFIYRL